MSVLSAEKKGRSIFATVHLLERVHHISALSP